MDNFFVNLTLNGVVHKRVEGGFRPLNTFNDGFEFQIECSEQDTVAAMDRILSQIRFLLGGEGKGDGEENEKDKTESGGGKELPHYKEGESSGG